MGSWGYKALESDNGLDVVDFLTDYISESKDQVDLSLSKLIAKMKEDGFLGETFEDIDYLYDNSAMALTELYLMFKENGELDYDHEEENLNLRKRVESFSGDKNALEFLLRYLTDIQNEVPDEDGEREFVELWKDAPKYEQWKEHLNYLINGLKSEL
ncbi:DUF4259 domain-containing protein [Soonwooa sp.]|uniref:DUF4259 domain-containing protein n=1 Tax=Soonwooa sp. TaxID=1938592 RepID=UPI002622F4B9|nr:DUF4259 domain-containing protein [Soonwooa sp.]